MQTTTTPRPALDDTPIPFPKATEAPPTDRATGGGHRAIAAVRTVSRRIDDLARELNCLGWFDGDDDRPRAA